MAFIDKKKVFSGWNSMDDLVKAATWGDPAAQCRLGELYLYGFNVTKIDYTEAAKWFRLAAEQGFARAKSKLGLMNELGQGLPVDQERALAWVIYVNMATAACPKTKIRLMNYTKTHCYDWKG